eukprot:CAMPEP_0194410312 /NCGR_PEP_ID=MMETSP0176-20130528/8364_1 /TAXON_ID=216777 /ORGANISM="Proboscia alata, Strain PI-D3" /LENGTH=114 /DNA_ID=CAMNT_0039211573 /DNA_START=101 /DNA_END=441 /DNA_ORIENTATION=-
MTPAIVIFFAGQHMIRYVQYVLLKLGKSRRDTYKSLRKVLLDIERLLVMRDCPPDAPPPLLWGIQTNSDHLSSATRPNIVSDRENNFTELLLLEPKIASTPPYPYSSQRNVLKP